MKCGWVSDVTASIARLESTQCTTMAQTPTRSARTDRISETISEKNEENCDALCQIHNAPKGTNQNYIIVKMSFRRFVYEKFYSIKSGGFLFISF